MAHYVLETYQSLPIKGLELLSETINDIIICGYQVDTLENFRARTELVHLGELYDNVYVSQGSRLHTKTSNMFGS